MYLFKTLGVFNVFNIFHTLFKHLLIFSFYFYIALQFCTALGATIVPMTFIIVDEMTQSVSAAVFASLLVVFGKFFLTIKK